MKTGIRVWLTVVVALVLSSGAFATVISTWTTSTGGVTTGWLYNAETLVAPGTQFDSYTLGFDHQLATTVTLSIYNWLGDNPVGSPLYTTSSLTWIGDGYEAANINLAVTPGSLYGVVVYFGGYSGSTVIFGLNSYPQGQAEWSFDGTNWTAYSFYNDQFIAVFSGGTPEPSSIILLGSGLLATAGIVRRQLIRG
jgi:hypothetical protein